MAIVKYLIDFGKKTVSSTSTQSPDKSDCLLKSFFLTISILPSAEKMYLLALKHEMITKV